MSDPGERAELRYQGLILRAVNAVDMIDLASLPDARDSLIAPELRRLYIPLRVRTLIPADIPDPPGGGVAAGRQAEMESRRAPVGERLAAVPRLVVLGEPGAGKSTLVRWLATAYLLRLRSIRDWIGLPDVSTLPFDPLLPVVVPCRNLDATAAAGSLDDLLRHTLRQTELAEDETEALLARLHDRLRQGRLLLLFDGLDAVGDLTARASLARLIEQTSLSFPQTFVVVTSRPAGYRELGFRLGRGFEHVALAELSGEDKEVFARLWYRLHEPRPERRQRLAEELIRAIHGSSRIERLAGNPMLLITMALVLPALGMPALGMPAPGLPDAGRLPYSRAGLYGQAVDRLLRPVAPPEALPQLEVLAYALCDRGLQQLPQTEVLGLLEALRHELPADHPVCQRSAGDFLRFIERSTGILRRAEVRGPQGVTGPVFEFPHPAFQEYLAARALVDGCFPGRDPQRTLAEQVSLLAGRTITRPDGEVTLSERWREVLRLCAACSGESAGEVLLALLRPLPGENEEATARPRAVLAALCLADEPEVGEPTAQEVLDGLACQVRDHEGSLLWRTGLDHAVRGLAESRWLPRLRLALVREFRTRAAAERWSLGFLLMKLASLSELAGGETTERNVAPGDEDDTAFALEVVGRAFAAAEIDARALGDRLLPLLSGSPATAHAAAWALYSLLGRSHDAAPWRPTAAELEQISGLVARPDLDTAAAWCLGKILARARKRIR